MSIHVINFLNYTKPIQPATFSHLLFFLSILSIIFEFVITQYFKTKSVFLFLLKKKKDIFWWAGLKEQVSGTGQYEDPLIPFPPEAENKVSEMLLYKELTMPDTFQNISHTYWILN